MNGCIQCEWRRVPKEESEIIRYEMDKDQKALYTLTVATLYQPTSTHCHRRHKTTTMMMIVNWCIIICEMRAMSYHHITEKGGAQSVG